MTAFDETYFRSRDGLTLYCRDYKVTGNSVPVLCLPGLTRNVRDFEDLAPRLANGGRRVLAMDFRGRGRSQYDPKPENYTPAVYVGDVQRLLEELKLDKAIFIGTSLGGIVTMLVAAAAPGTVQAAVLNDVGPVVKPDGVRRIRSYVGKTPRVDNWDAAAEAVCAVYGPVYPDFETDDWLKMARRSYRDVAPGQIVADYDPAIAVPFEKDENAAPPGDPWVLFEALKPIPTLVVRGASSDILSAETLGRMLELKPDLRTCIVAGRGHPPLLTEPPCLNSLEPFLASLP